MGAKRLRPWLLAASFAVGIAATAAWGQDYPAMPITLVNPYAAGGPADLLARTVATGSRTIYRRIPRG